MNLVKVNVSNPGETDVLALRRLQTRRVLQEPEVAVVSRKYQIRNSDTMRPWVVRGTQRYARPKIEIVNWTRMYTLAGQSPKGKS